jgi:hypothetical protein
MFNNFIITLKLKINGRIVSELTRTGVHSGHGIKETSNGHLGLPDLSPHTSKEPSVAFTLRET